MKTNLSKTEWRIAEALTYFSTVKRMADVLCISEGTVRVHLRNIYAKLGFTSSNQLVTYYLCNRYDIELERDLKAVANRLRHIAVLFLLLMIPQIVDASTTAVRPMRVRTSVTRTIRRAER